jgi:hypothetical protein
MLCMFEWICAGSLSCPGPLWRVHPELPRYKLEHMSTVHMSTNFARSGGKNISHDYLVRQQAMSDQHKTADCRLSTKYKTFSDPMLERILVRNPLSLDKCQVQVKLRELREQRIVLFSAVCSHDEL